MIASFYDTNKRVTMLKADQHWMVEWEIDDIQEFMLFTSEAAALAQYVKLI